MTVRPPRGARIAGIVRVGIKHRIEQSDQRGSANVNGLVHTSIVLLLAHSTDCPLIDSHRSMYATYSPREEPFSGTCFVRSHTHTASGRMVAARLFAELPSRKVFSETGL